MASNPPVEAPIPTIRKPSGFAAGRPDDGVGSCGGSVVLQAVVWPLYFWCEFWIGQFFSSSFAPQPQHLFLGVTETTASSGRCPQLKG
jgi:hypothetical protein